MGDFRDASLLVVLSASHLDRLRGVEGCGKYCATTSEDDCAVALDKRAQVKETWPGVGALVHGMEDEFPEVRLGAVRSIGQIALAHPRLRNQCVKVVLEGLQDSSRRIRLLCAEVALQCQPKQLGAPELRLLLETLTSDDSEQVKGAILDFFLEGPAFVETSHAAVSLEWLATLPNCSNAFLYRFGVRHAESLYFASAMLEKCRSSSREGVIAGLAGASSVWGIPLSMSNPQMRESVEALMGHYAGRAKEIILAEEMLNDAISNPSPHRVNLSAFPNVAEFVSNFTKATTKEARSFLMHTWSGFREQTWADLKEWESSGQWPTGKRLLLSHEDSEWEDTVAPRKVDFEIACQVEFLPTTCQVGFARYRVFVKGKHVGERHPLLCIANTSRTFDLTVKERNQSIVVYDPISIQIPFVGSPPKECPVLYVDFLGCCSAV